MSLSPIESAQTNLSQPEDCWLESSDGQKLFFRYWQGKPGLPTIIYLHGIEGHSGWFARTAFHLNQMGFSIFAPDRRGAGANSFERGHLTSYKLLLDDLRLLVNLAKQKSQDSPLFLFGNCWGAKLAIVASVCLKDTNFSGLILTSPAIKAKVDVSLATKIAIGTALFCHLKRRFAFPLTIEMFTDNPEFLNYIASDRLRLTDATPSFFFENVKLSLLAKHCARQLLVPLLVLQAGSDQIVSVKAVREWFDQVVSKDKTLHVLENEFHSLDFGCKIDQYLAYLSTWIDAHSTRGKL